MQILFHLSSAYGIYRISGKRAICMRVVGGGGVLLVLDAQIWTPRGHSALAFFFRTVITLAFAV